MRVVAVSDGMIRLGQFLKLVNMVNAGSEAKRAIAAGSVGVNDVELRRGRQLHSGDVVAVGNERARVAGSSSTGCARRAALDGRGYGRRS